MVSIRLLMANGVSYTKQYVQRFGFSDADVPANLSMALGSGAATPMQMAEGYAVFANGGYKVSAYVIDKIYDGQGRLRAQMQPLVAGENAPQIIDPRNAYVMYNMMRDVVKLGTAKGANALGRSDIAGKTGTTNDNKDAWFVGFNPDVVAAVFIGYDKPRSIGRSAFGGTIALPVWVDYMRYALKDIPSKGMNVPSGMVVRGGEYFLKEQQSTSSAVKLDNRASRQIDASERDADTPTRSSPPPRKRAEPANQDRQSDRLEGEVELKPRNRPAPVENSRSGGGGEDLDSLF